MMHSVKRATSRYRRHLHRGKVCRTVSLSSVYDWSTEEGAAHNLLEGLYE